MKQEREERGGENEGRNENERERGRKEMKEREKKRILSQLCRDPAVGVRNGEEA